MTQRHHVSKEQPRVRFFHLRTRNNGIPSEKGGHTVAYKRRNDGNYSVSICQCNTNQRYDERLGEKIADMRLSRGQFFVQSRADFIATLQTLHNKLSSGTPTKLNVDELVADSVHDYDQQQAA